MEDSIFKRCKLFFKKKISMEGVTSNHHDLVSWATYNVLHRLLQRDAKV